MGVIETDQMNDSKVSESADFQKSKVADVGKAVNDYS